MWTEPSRYRHNSSLQATHKSHVHWSTLHTWIWSDTWGCLMVRQIWEIPLWGPHNSKLRRWGNSSVISGCVAPSGPQTRLAHSVAEALPQPRSCRANCSHILTNCDLEMRLLCPAITQRPPLVSVLYPAQLNDDDFGAMPHKERVCS